MSQLWQWLLLYWLRLYVIITVSGMKRMLSKEKKISLRFSAIAMGAS